MHVFSVWSSSIISVITEIIWTYLSKGFCSERYSVPFARGVIRHRSTDVVRLRTKDIGRCTENKSLHRLCLSPQHFTLYVQRSAHPQLVTWPRPLQNKQPLNLVARKNSKHCLANARTLQILESKTLQYTINESKDQFVPQHRIKDNYARIEIGRHRPSS